MLSFKQLRERLEMALEIEVDLGVSFEKDALKRTPAAELKSEWDLYRSEIRRVVKPLGGLITDTKSPSNKAAPNGKRIGTVTVGTRGDASKLDPAKIKAALSKNVEVNDMTITRLDESLEESKEYQKDMDMIAGMIKKGEHKRVAGLIKRTAALKGGGGWNLTQKPSKAQKDAYNKMVRDHKKKYPELYKK